MHSAGAAADVVVALRAVAPRKVVVRRKVVVARKAVVVVVLKVVVALRAATDPGVGRRPERIGLHKSTLKVVRRGTCRLRQ